jgi:hypothetical protein
VRANSTETDKDMVQWPKTLNTKMNTLETGKVSGGISMRILSTCCPGELRPSVGGA